MQTRLNSLALLSFAFILACGGCASVDSERPDAVGSEDMDAEDVDTAPDITGPWASACTPQPQADGSTQYFRLLFDITEAAWDLDYKVFGDDACATELVTVAIAGPYGIDGPSASVEGAYEARFGFSTKTITAHVEPLAEMLNSLEPCGSETFVVGEAQSVYAEGCPAFGQYPSEVCGADYDLIKREGETLVFGNRPADNDMCQPDRRPSELSQLVLNRS